VLPVGLTPTPLQYPDAVPVSPVSGDSHAAAEWIRQTLTLSL